LQLLSRPQSESVLDVEKEVGQTGGGSAMAVISENARQAKVDQKTVTHEKTIWDQFLSANERVVFTGLIQKRSFSGMGIRAKKRQLILTSMPRILYVDPDIMQVSQPRSPTTTATKPCCTL
jgi:hypothetical protein